MPTLLKNIDLAACRTHIVSKKDFIRFEKDNNRLRYATACSTRLITLSPKTQRNTSTAALVLHITIPNIPKNVQYSSLSKYLNYDYLFQM